MRIILSMIIISLVFAVSGKAQSYAKKQPIVEAVINGNASEVRRLINNPSKANLQDSYGVSLLHLAWNHQHRDVFQTLLSLGAKVNIPNLDGQTIVHVIARAGPPAWLEDLAEKKPQWDVRDKQGLTPLMLAVTENQVETVLTLIGLGAKTHFRDLTGRDALEHARRNDNQEMVELLEALQ